MRTLSTALLLCSLALPATAADSGADITLRADDRVASTQGPLALADTLQPGLAPATPSGSVLQAELRHVQRLPGGLSLHGNALLAHEQLNGRRGSDRSRVNQLNTALDLGPWQLSAGKKVLGWDVGYGFRPNDVVQQETRREIGRAHV